MELKTALPQLILLLKLFCLANSLEAAEWCPYGWREFENKCYNIYGNGDELERNFDEAEHICKENGGNLVSIHSREEQDFLTAYLVSTSPGRALWIGLTKPPPSILNTEPIWVDGSGHITFRNFGLGEPDGGLDHSCFVMENDAYELGRWDDRQCSAKHAFVCQRKTIIGVLDDRWCAEGFTHFRGECYRLEANKADFWSAETQCKTKYDSGLVLVKDIHEQAFMSKLARSLKDKVWMGFSNHNGGGEDGFDWSDARNVHHFKRSEEPGALLEAKCVVAAPEGQGWTVEDCSKKNSFVCRRRTTKTENERKIHVGECPEGWLDVKNDFCYYVETEEHQTVIGSQIACAKKTPRGELALLESPDSLFLLGPELRKFENRTFLIQVKESVVGESNIVAPAQCVEVDSGTLEYKRGCVVERNFICQTVKGTLNTTVNKESKGVATDELKVTEDKLSIPEPPAKNIRLPDIPNKLRVLYDLRHLLI